MSDIMRLFNNATLKMGNNNPILITKFNYEAVGTTEEEVEKESSELVDRYLQLENMKNDLSQLSFMAFGKDNKSK